MAGRFTVVVDNKGKLATPFSSGNTLDFLGKNGIATESYADNKANKAETNANTYTDAEVKKVADELAAVKTFSVKVVNKLPDSGEEKTIYLVPSTNTTEKNIKDEYLYINGEWEQIGTTAINLEAALTPINNDINALMDAFPTEKPNIVNPKVSISINPNTTKYEVGTKVTDLKLTSTFTKGTYSPKYTEGQFNDKTDGIFDFCGDATSCTWYGGVYSNPAIKTSTNVYSDTITKTFSEFTTYTISSTTTYVKIDDSVYNNKGNTTGVTQPSTLSGTINSSEITIYGTLPIYGTTSSISILTKQSDQIKSTQNTVEIELVAQTSSNNLQMVLIPQDWCGEDGVSKIEQYDDIRNKWDDITSNFTQIKGNTWENIVANNNVISSYNLNIDQDPMDTSKEYTLLVNTGGNVGKRKIRITK